MDIFAHQTYSDVKAALTTAKITYDHLNGVPGSPRGRPIARTATRGEIAPVSRSPSSEKAVTPRGILNLPKQVRFNMTNPRVNALQANGDPKGDNQPLTRKEIEELLAVKGLEINNQNIQAMEDILQQFVVTGETPHTALVNKMKNFSQRYDNRRGNCFVCGQLGHYQNDCPLRGQPSTRILQRSASTSPRPPPRRRRESSSSDPGYTSQGTQKVYANVMTMEQIRNSQSEEWDPDNEGYFAVTHGNHPLNSDLYDNGEYTFVQCNVLITGVTEVSPEEPLLPAEVPPDPPQNQGRCPKRKSRKRAYSSGDQGSLTPIDWDSPTYPVTPATSSLECDRCSPGPESGTWQEAALAAYYYRLSDWEEENQEERPLWQQLQLRLEREHAMEQERAIPEVRPEGGYCNTVSLETVRKLQRTISLDSLPSEFRITHGRHPMRETSDDDAAEAQGSICAVATTSHDRPPPVPPRVTSLPGPGTMVHPPAMPLMELPQDLKAALARADAAMERYDTPRRHPPATLGHTLLSPMPPEAQRVEEFHKFLNEQQERDTTWRDRYLPRIPEKDNDLPPPPDVVHRPPPPSEALPRAPTGPINYSRPRSLIRINRVNETLGYAPGTPWKQRMDDWWSRWSRQWRSHESRPRTPQDTTDEETPLTRLRPYNDIVEAHNRVCCRGWVLKGTVIGAILLIALLILGPMLGPLIWPSKILSRIKTSGGIINKVLTDLTSDDYPDWAALDQKTDRLDAIQDAGWADIHEIVTVAPPAEPTTEEKLGETLKKAFLKGIQEPKEFLEKEILRNKIPLPQDDPYARSKTDEDIAQQWRTALTGMASQTRKAQRRVDEVIADSPEGRNTQTAQHKLDNLIDNLDQLTQVATGMAQSWGQDLSLPEEPIESSDGRHVTIQTDGDQLVVTTRLDHQESSTIKIPQEEVPVATKPVASPHTQDPLAKNREQAMQEMADIYGALESLDDHDFVNRHLGPDALRVDPLITKAPPPVKSRSVRDTQPQMESLLGMNENNTVTLGTLRNETSSSQLAIKNCTEAHTSNDTEIDHFLEWVCEQDKRERQAMAYHYWAKTLQGVFEPPALPEGPDTTLVREQARRVLDDHHNALLGTAKAAYVIARGVSLTGQPEDHRSRRSELPQTLQLKATLRYQQAQISQVLRVNELQEEYIDALRTALKTQTQTVRRLWRELREVRQMLARHGPPASSEYANLRRMILTIQQQIRALHFSAFDQLQAAGSVPLDIATRQEVNALVQSQQDVAQTVAQMQKILTRVLATSIKASQQARDRMKTIMRIMNARVDLTAKQSRFLRDTSNRLHNQTQRLVEWRRVILQDIKGQPSPVDVKSIQESIDQVSEAAINNTQQLDQVIVRRWKRGVPDPGYPVTQAYLRGARWALSRSLYGSFFTRILREVFPVLESIVARPTRRVRRSSMPLRSQITEKNLTGLEVLSKYRFRYPKDWTQARINLVRAQQFDHLMRKDAVKESLALTAGGTTSSICQH